MVTWLCKCDGSLVAQPDQIITKDGLTAYFHIYRCPTCHTKTRYHFFLCTQIQNGCVCGTELTRYDQRDTPTTLAYRCPKCHVFYTVDYQKWELILPKQEET